MAGGIQGRILVVDPDEEFRERIIGLLSVTFNADEIEAAADDLKALELYRQHPGDVDLVIAGLSAPVSTGNLFEQILTVNPGQRCIVCASGSKALAGLELSERFRALSRPFRGEALLNLITQMRPATAQA